MEVVKSDKFSTAIAQFRLRYGERGTMVVHFASTFMLSCCLGKEKPKVSGAN